MTEQAKLVIMAAAMTGILVGAAMVASRFAVDQTGPAGLALLRYLIGAAILAPIVFSTHKLRFERQDFLPIAILGMVQFGVLIALLNYGLQFVPAGRAALIFSSFPLMTLILGAMLGREAMTLNKTLGVLFTIVAVGVVLGEALFVNTGTSGEFFGSVAILASAFCGALCSVLYGPYLRKYPVLPVSFVAMLAANALLIILAVPEGIVDALPKINQTGWLAILFDGLASALGYFLWLWALAHTTATRVTVFMSLSPLTAAILGALFLDEALTPGIILALALMAFGLWLSHR